MNAEGACGGWRLAVPVDGRWRGGVGDGGVRMLAGVCAVLVVPLCAVPMLRPVNGVRRGEGPVLGGASWGRSSRLVEQEFEEVGLVRVGQGGCMLQVFVGAVRELLRRLGNGCPLHVRRRGLGVLRVGA